jgi:hypothetical protein
MKMAKLRYQQNKKEGSADNLATTWSDFEKIYTKPSDVEISCNLKDAPIPWKGGNNAVL